MFEQSTVMLLSSIQPLFESVMCIAQMQLIPKSYWTHKYTLLSQQISSVITIDAPYMVAKSLSSTPSKIYQCSSTSRFSASLWNNLSGSCPG